MERELIAGILDGARRAKIAVVGEYHLEVKWLIDENASWKPSEADLPTWHVDRQTTNLGGAGNVVRNLVSLGCENVVAYGIIGDDGWGQLLGRKLFELGVDCTGIRTQAENWATNAFIRANSTQDELKRMAFGYANRADVAISNGLLARLEEQLPDLDIAVIYQQAEDGFFTAPFIDGLRGLIAEHRDTTFIVRSQQLGGVFPGALLVTDDRAALRMVDLEAPDGDAVPRDDSRAAAEMLARRVGKPVIVTRGARGCVVATEDGVHVIPGIQVPRQIDTLGAEDALLAGISVSLASGQDALIAANIGNFAAAVSIDKPYETATVKPDELLDMGNDPVFVWRPELAADLRKARYYRQTEFEIVTDIREGFAASHVILDHDGTISVLRQGWEVFMEEVMVKAVLGAAYDSVSESVFQQVLDHIRFYIDKTTGVQTLVQMVGLVEMVRDFGFVPEDEVKDEFAYKEIYNDALMKMVNRRVGKFRRGELSRDDYLMKNAFPLLERLHGSGVELYLASGTDEEDVIEEATTLGYAEFFEGRIYGAVGDVKIEAKRQALERIIADIGDGVHQGLVAIGDGPVEMRETKKRGGLSIGIASDEVRRYGLNPAKRKRLIQAGADIIIPDYSQLEAFLSLLGV